MSSQSALYSLCRLRPLALASALPLAGCYATPSLDNPRFENGPDGQDLRSLVYADDGDCDGTLAADDCDDADPDSLTRTEDGDCDGALTGYDCDDADPDSLTRAEDGDCDGTLPADDCNDADPNSLTRALDRDCDGAPTADDCNDADPNSLTRALDGDCDGARTADDCDDGDPNSLTRAEDKDCDGVVVGEILGGFWVNSQGIRVARTETTVAQYRPCVAAGVCSEPDSFGTWSLNPGSFEDHPVIKVDWFQATAFCGWVGGRLPTAVEWQEVASNGGTTEYPWGDEEPDGTLVNFEGLDAFVETAPACSFPSGNNDDGVCDLTGNVWEWTATPFGSRTKEVRGGSWDNPGPFPRASDRIGTEPVYRLEEYGFRCVQ